MAYLHTYYVTKRGWKKILSFLVRFFQGTEYDHCGFGISLNGVEPYFIQEAVLRGVVETPFDEFISNHSFVVSEFKVPITDEETQEILDLVSDHKGKSYSFMQLVGNAFAVIMKKCFNYNVRKNLFSNGWKKLVCAEYVGAVLRLVGGQLPEGKNFETLDVKDCFEMNKNIERAIRKK